ncbi:MAG: signal peptide peptidase SppA [Beijerinckiaceae bacterium]
MTAFSGPHADTILDRRRLRRKVTFWRGVALVIAIAAIAVIGWRAARGGAPGPRDAHIARVQISGLITGDRPTLDMLKEIGKSNAKAVLLSIESPGGTTTGSEKLFEEIRELGKKKPVVAVVGSVAASGAYIAAISADRIFAHKNSIVGSIGVLVQIPNVSRLLDTVGVKVDIVRSTPLKAAPSGLEPTSPEARQALADIVADSYDWFKGLVQERRKLSADELAKVVDGRVHTGRQSMALKLVDEIGGEREAIAWLEKERKVPAKLRIRDWKKKSGAGSGWFTTGAAAIANAAGLTSLAAAIHQTGEAARFGALDGLLAVWQGYQDH